MWNETVKKALYAHTHADQFAYLYGADGQTGIDELVDEMVYMYSSHFKEVAKSYNTTLENLIAEIKEFVRGKTCFDCSGFICYLVNDNKYDANSTALNGYCNKHTTISAGVAGSLLWKQGHVGIDIGYGYFIHMPNELRSVEIGKNSEYDWKQSGELAGEQFGIDYTGATER
jgi:NurA-like 5'-3' nuclease